MHFYAIVTHQCVPSCQSRHVSGGKVTE